MFQVPFLEPCVGCGGFAEIETESEYLVLDAAHANAGDIVSCSRCKCSGVIEMGIDYSYCRWDDEWCDICWADVVARVKKMLRLVQDGVSYG